MILDFTLIHFLNSKWKERLMNFLFVFLGQGDPISFVFWTSP